MNTQKLLLLFFACLIGLSVKAQEDILHLNPADFSANTILLQGQNITFIQGDSIIINRQILPLQVVARIEVIYHNKLKEIKGSIENLAQGNQKAREAISQLQVATAWSVQQAQQLVQEFKTHDLIQSNTLLRKARDAFERGDIERTLSLLDELALEEEDRKLADTYRFKARALATQFQFESAETNFASAARVFPGFDNIKSYSDFLSQQKKYTQVVRFLKEQALDNPVQAIYIHSRLSFAYIHTEAFEKSLQAAEKMLARTDQLVLTEDSLVQLKFKDYLLAEANSNLANVSVLVANYAQAVTHYQKAIELIQPVIEVNKGQALEYQIAQIVYLSNMGDTHRNMDSIAQARPYYEKALKVAQQIEQENELSLYQKSFRGWIHQRLALNYFNELKFVEGKKHIEQAINTHQALSDLNPVYAHDLARNYLIQAIIDEALGDIEDAYQGVVKGMNIYDQLPEEAYLQKEKAIFHYYLAIYFWDKEDFDNAWKHLEPAIQIIEERFQQNETNEANEVFSRIFQFDLLRFSLYYYSAKIHESDEEYLSFLKKAWEAFDNATYKNQYMREAAFYCLMQISEFSPQPYYVEQAQLLFQKNFSDTILLDNKIRWGELQHGLGNYYFMANQDNQQAIPYFEKAVEVRRDIIREEPSNMSHYVASNHRLRECYVNLGELEQALPYNHQAIEGRKYLLTTPRRNTFLFPLGASYHVEGQLLYDLGRYEEAAQYFDLALPILKEAFKQNSNNTYFIRLIRCHLDYGRLCYAQFLESGDFTYREEGKQHYQTGIRIIDNSTNPIGGPLRGLLQRLLDSFDIQSTKDRKHDHIVNLFNRAENLLKEKGWRKPAMSWYRESIKASKAYMQADFCEHISDAYRRANLRLFNLEREPEKLLSLSRDFVSVMKEMDHRYGLVYYELSSAYALHASALLLQNELKAARQVLKDLQKIDNISPQYLSLLGIFYILEGKYPKAEKLWSRVKKWDAHENFKNEIYQTFLLLKHKGLAHPDMAKASVYLENL